MGAYLLFEAASGYALFEVNGAEEIGEKSDEMQQAVQDFGRFSQIVKLKAFSPFTSAENALENINAISEGLLPELLKNFLEQNMPKLKDDKKAKKISLWVSEPGLSSAIQKELSIPCVKADKVLEYSRGVRLHLGKFIKDLKEGDVEKAQLGLAHGYSRAKVKFNVDRVDNMIIQSICLLDQLDKDLNTFAMRVREWYGWHFPELIKIVPDNYTYAKLANFIGNKDKLSEEQLEGIEAIVGDAGKAKDVLDAARASMGTDISEFDMTNISQFSKRVIELSEYRQKLHAYLKKKMQDCAPNLSALIGELVGARLISHAGSLTNLAKYPASTVQILGAEKALFRALKTRGSTPKYGLIFHSTFIGRASTKNKGRISRYLANKCSIAARIDTFSEVPTSKFGEKLKEQVEERLKFYDTGEAPRKNIEVMKEVMEEVKKETETPKKKKKSKDKKKDEEDEDKPAEDGEAKKSKKKKKRTAEEIEEVEEPKTEKKKKKKKSQE